MRNEQFPAANYDGNGIPTWSSSAITAFAATMATVANNSWRVDYNTALPSANRTQLSPPQRPVRSTRRLPTR